MDKLSRLLYSTGAAMLLMCSCFSADRDFNAVFNRSERAAFGGLVSAYDDFITMQVQSDIRQIPKAYSSYLSLNAIMAAGSRDMTNLCPARDRLDEVFGMLDEESLSEVLVSDESGGLCLSRTGIYMDILEVLADRKDLYRQMRSTATSGSGPLYGDYTVVSRHAEIDFSNRLERLVFVLNVLTARSVQSPL